MSAHLTRLGNCEKRCITATVNLKAQASRFSHVVLPMNITCQSFSLINFLIIIVEIVKRI